MDLRVKKLQICKKCRDLGLTADSPDRWLPGRVKIGERRLKATQKMISEVLSERRGAGPTILQELDEIVDKFGGPEGIAKKLRDTYEAAKPGSSERIRILQSILKISESLREYEDELDWSGMDDDDLDAVIVGAVSTSEQSENAKPGSNAAAG